MRKPNLTYGRAISQLQDSLAILSHIKEKKKKRRNSPVKSSEGDSPGTLTHPNHRDLDKKLYHAYYPPQYLATTSTELQDSDSDLQLRQLQDTDPI